jgi:hypothetical protein
MPLLTRCPTSQLSADALLTRCLTSQPSADAPAKKQVCYDGWMESSIKKGEKRPTPSHHRRERLHTRWCRFCLSSAFRRGRSTLSVPRTIRLPHSCEERKRGDEK